MAQKKNSLRIIGGTWRSRRIQFVDNPEIRPTPDRVRETLFNWLADLIIDARCLDLFAGSGALGFEAASRGASQVVLVDKDKPSAQMLDQQKKLLAAHQLEIVHQDALAYLQQASQQFDLVFLDPPFNSGLLENSLQFLIERQLVRVRGLIYAELSAQAKSTEILQGLHCIREKVAGQVKYVLLEVPK